MKYRLRKHETLEQGLQRILPALLLRASREAGAGDASQSDRVHTVRKRLKRARAIHKLARPVLREELYLREQTWFRDLGRGLSDARDMDVLIQTHRRLALQAGITAEADGPGEAVPGALRRLSKVAYRATPPGRLLAAVADELVDKAREWKAVPWAPTEALSIGGALKPGIESYIRALDAVNRSATGERIHTLRKRVKDLAYQMDFVASRISAARKRLRRKAYRLGELLGWHHDVWVYAGRLASLDDLSDAVRGSWAAMVEAEENRVAQRAIAKAEKLRRAIASELGKG